MDPHGRIVAPRSPTIHRQAEQADGVMACGRYYKVLNRSPSVQVAAMKKGPGKAEIVSFKVDPELAKALRQVPNRSEFIRRALASALDGVCPLCHGSGFLDRDERRHWDAFAERHAVERCQDCESYHLVCLSDESSEADSADGQPS